MPEGHFSTSTRLDVFEIEIEHAWVHKPYPFTYRLHGVYTDRDMAVQRAMSLRWTIGSGLLVAIPEDGEEEMWATYVRPDKHTPDKKRLDPPIECKGCEGTFSDPGAYTNHARVCFGALAYSTIKEQREEARRDAAGKGRISV